MKVVESSQFEILKFLIENFTSELIETIYSYTGVYINLPGLLGPSSALPGASEVLRLETEKMLNFEFLTQNLKIP